MCLLKSTPTQASRSCRPRETMLEQFRRGKRTRLVLAGPLSPWYFCGAPSKTPQHQQNRSAALPGADGSGRASRAAWRALVGPNHARRCCQAGYEPGWAARCALESGGKQAPVSVLTVQNWSR